MKERPMQTAMPSIDTLSTCYASSRARHASGKTSSLEKHQVYRTSKNPSDYCLEGFFFDSFILGKTPSNSAIDFSFLACVAVSLDRIERFEERYEEKDGAESVCPIGSDPEMPLLRSSFASCRALFRFVSIRCRTISLMWLAKSGYSCRTLLKSC